jgi:hypothetical protein
MEMSTRNVKGNLLLFLLCAIIAPILTVAGRDVQEPIKEQISVSDARPVALAAEMLEKKYGWIITYEDPAYVHESELVDVTEKVRRDLDKFEPGKAPRVLIPKGGTLTFEYAIDPDTKTPPDSAVVVQQLLDAYALSGNPGIFRLDRDGPRLHIVTSHPSVLDASIILRAHKRNGLELLEAFCTAVSQASGTRVVMATVPLNLFNRYETQSGAKDQKAREFLSNELDRIKVKLSWQLLYDPVTKSYFLNIHVV